MRLVVTPGYNVAFDCFDLPASIEVVMVAPRMMGVGIGGPDRYGWTAYQQMMFAGEGEDHVKRFGMLGLGIILGISIPILFVWGMIRWFAYAFKKLRELETSGIRVMAMVTRLDEREVHFISMGSSPQARNLPRKYYRLSAHWQDPRTGKAYTLKSMIGDPTKFPVGSSVAFLINPKHPRWLYRLENLQDAFGLHKPFVSE